MTANIQKASSHRGERGQSLVELAISLTVMLLLLSGAVTFGMALFSYVAVRDAAGEGALYGSIKPYLDNNANGKYDSGEPVNGADICARVKAASNRPINMTGFSCTTGVYVPGGGGHNTGNAIDVSAVAGNAAGSPCENGSGGGDPNGILVTVDYDQGVFMPYIGAITGQNIHLRAQVTDTILEPRCP
jgi:hypothetical protein